jgi:hypothetical protein
VIRRGAALLAFACAPRLLGAQALPFHTQSALTTAFEERALRGIVMAGTRENVTVAVTSLVVLPFAPHQRVTTMVVLPLVHKRMTADPGGGETLYSETGLGDITLAVKWAFLARDRFAGTTRLALMVTGRLPTGSTGASLRAGGVAPRPLQVGSGAFAAGVILVGTVVRGRWGISADLGHTWSATGDGYQFGPVTRYDLAIGVRFPDYIETIRTKTLQVYLEWNGSVSGNDRADGVVLPNSGGHVAFLSPGLQWVVLPQLLFEGSVQLPVIQDHNGMQPDFGLRGALGARFLFF